MSIASVIVGITPTIRQAFGSAVYRRAGLSISLFVRPFAIRLRIEFCLGVKPMPIPSREARRGEGPFLPRNSLVESEAVSIRNPHVYDSDGRGRSIGSAEPDDLIAFGPRAGTIFH